MGPYYMLECYASSDQYYYQRIGGLVKPGRTPSWLTGQRFDVPIPEPLELTWDPDTEGPRKYIYHVGVPLYHRDIYLALREAGVDNIDAFRTRIVDPRTGAASEEYLAINVIGLVAAADLGESDHVAFNPRSLFDTDFDSLALDPAATLDLLMFRLAECVTGVVVSGRVKAMIEARASAADLVPPTFVRPEAWLG